MNDKIKELSKEDKQRIEKSAVIYSVSAVKNIDGALGELVGKLEVISYKDGAFDEHPIAFQQGETKGFNEGIEAAKKLIFQSTISEVNGEIALSTSFSKSLEKLKK